jgi:hypothetical protein
MSWTRPTKKAMKLIDFCKPRHRFSNIKRPSKEYNKSKGVKVVDALWLKIL